MVCNIIQNLFPWVLGAKRINTLKPVLLVVLLSACGGIERQERLVTFNVEPRDLTGEERAHVMALVRTQLKDPESARFGRVFSFTNHLGNVETCVWVNAKNSFGGYTGETAFQFLDSGKIISDESLDLGLNVITRTCVEAGDGQISRYVRVK